MSRIDPVFQQPNITEVTIVEEPDQVDEDELERLAIQVLEVCFEQPRTQRSQRIFEFIARRALARQIVIPLMIRIGETQAIS